MVIGGSSGIGLETAHLARACGADIIITAREPAGSGERAYLPTRRGYDDRLDTSTRPRADDRLLAKRGRRVRPDDEPEGGFDDIEDGG